MSDILDPAQSILQGVFKLNKFRSFQERVINHLIDGENALILLPTGGGKSLCYQIPSLVREGTGIVISPLISLMQDQVDSLRALGVNAAALNSTLTLKKMRELEEELLAGEVDILYVSPERFCKPSFQELISDVQVSLLAIDEAHCVSKWGHDFRPEYKKIHRYLKNFPQVPRVALTASADQLTRREIVNELKISNGKVFMGSFNRENIYYQVEEKSDQSIKKILNLINKYPSDSGIIYCISRKNTEAMAELLQSEGIKAKAYHAGLTAKERREVQEFFLSEDDSIIVATIAFGMGIDKSNVRYVIHFDLPRNLESYYQETGRAGRDGLPSEAHMFYSRREVAIFKSFIKKSRLSYDRELLESESVEQMLTYAQGVCCRRTPLLNAFDEDYPGNCFQCDVCNNSVGGIESSKDAIAILTIIHQVNYQFDLYELTDYLQGIIGIKAREHGFFNQPHFGHFAHKKEKDIYPIIRHLISQGFLKLDFEREGILSIRPKAIDLIQGLLSFYLPIPSKTKSSSKKKQSPLKQAKRKVSRKKSAAKAAKKAKQKSERPIYSNDPAVLKALKEKRREISKKKRIPAFKVFKDQTLEEMASTMPTTKEEMLDVYGVGEKNYKKYGKIFLDFIDTL